MNFERDGQSVWVGGSAAMARLRMQVERIAPHFRTVLVVGEEGAGKEAVGRELHRLSPAAADLFERMEMEDFVQQRGGGVGRCGVVYLRGLAQASAEVQDGLVRRLSELGREARLTRMVVACEAEPRGLLAAGRLRAEVLERVGMLEIRVPALRDRAEDLEALTGHMLERIGCGAGMGAEDFELMRKHGWPGNLPELWRVCAQFAACGRVKLETGSGSGVGNGRTEPEEVKLDQVIARHVMRVLEGCAGNKLRAAELLGISRSTLYRMLDAAGQAG